MESLFYVLLVLGLLVIADPLVYIIAEHYYKNHTEAEKSNGFELLDVVFRHKHAKAIYIAVGVIFIASGVLIRIML